MKHKVVCPTADLLFRQITESLEMYTQAATHMLAAVDPKSSEFLAALDQLEEASYRLQRLRLELYTHYADHSCRGVLRRSDSESDQMVTA
jgi:hypothetical protein